MRFLIIIPISLLAIIGSPYVLWQAHSQQRASDFQSATYTDSNMQVVDDYIRIEGSAIGKEPVSCPETNKTKTSDECIYVSTVEEIYTRAEKEVCSDTRPTETILQNLEPECDDEGNCEPCYLVETFDWEQYQNSKVESDIIIGNYEIPTVSGANLIGLSQYQTIIPSNQVTNELSQQESSPSSQTSTFNVGDRRITNNFLENETELVVVGTAAGGEIFRQNKEFVVSALSTSETLTQLQNQDRNSAITLTIISFLMMVGGFIVLFNTVASIPLLLTKVIPWIGDDIQRITNSIVTFVSGLAGLILWCITYVIVFVFKTLWLLAIVVGIVGFLGYRIWQKQKETVV